MLGNLPISTFSSIRYEKNIYRLTVAKPVVSVNPVAMNPESYYIDDPPMVMVQEKPLVPYTFVMNPNTIIAPTGDTRFIINYNVYESLTNVRPPWITGYD